MVMLVIYIALVLCILPAQTHLVQCEDTWTCTQIFISLGSNPDTILHPQSIQSLAYVHPGTDSRMPLFKTPMAFLQQIHIVENCQISTHCCA